MKQTYRLYSMEDAASFSAFITDLSRRGKKFTVTPWGGTKEKAAGFAVWYYA